MPNQRDKDKSMIGGYVPTELAGEFKRVAEEKGVTVKDLLEQLIREAVKNGAKK